VSAARKLIDDLRAAGVRVTRRGDRLHVVADATLTPERKAWLAEHKTELLAELDHGDADIADTLRLLAGAEGVDPALIEALQPADLEGCHGLPDEVLRCYVRAVRDTDLREHGKRPADETAMAMCAHCGPVWIHPDVADVLPTVRGWPVCAGCAWCHVGNRSAMSRPAVTCGGCEHFVRDVLNPAQGMGRCSIGCEPQRPWPCAEHECEKFRPRGAA